jgi:hypothetical protein
MTQIPLDTVLPSSQPLPSGQPLLNCAWESVTGPAGATGPMSLLEQPLQELGRGEQVVHVHFMACSILQLSSQPLHSTKDLPTLLPTISVELEVPDIS